MSTVAQVAKIGSVVDLDTLRAVERFLFEYAAGLDDGEFDRWPEFFVDDCLYKIVSAENERRQLPMPIMYCDSRGMLLDRVMALKEINIYNIHWGLHLIGNIRVDRDKRGLDVNANFTTYQTTPEGVTSLFCIGRYRDKIVETPDGLRFKEKIVIVDTFSVPNLIAVPL